MFILIRQLPAVGSWWWGGKVLFQFPFADRAPTPGGGVLWLKQPWFLDRGWWIKISPLFLCTLFGEEREFVHFEFINSLH
jgi:hypothetical protein